MKMCEHRNGECLKVEEILEMPELQSRKMKNLDDIHQNDDLDINNDTMLEMIDYDDIKKEMRGYELIFLSHPFKDDPEANRLRCDYLAKDLKLMEEYHNTIILSPLHAFSYFEDDSMREAIMEECYSMIDRADKVIAIQYDGFMSSGQSDELLYAEETGTPIEVNDVYQLVLDRKLGIVE
jgi:hypothetical protein